MNHDLRSLAGAKLFERKEILMNPLRWPCSAVCTFIVALLLVLTPVALECWFEILWQQGRKSLTDDEPFGPFVAKLLRTTRLGTLMDFGIDSVRPLARRLFLGYARDKMTFDPFAVQRGELWRFLTAPFVTTHPIELLLNLIGLFLIGAEFESSLPWKRSVQCCIGLTVVPHLLSLALSFLNFREEIYSPCYFIVGLAVVYGHCQPNAVVSILGYGPPIRWVPWIWTLGVLLFGRKLFMAALMGLVGGWITARVICPKRQGSAKEDGERLPGGAGGFDQPLPVHQFEQPSLIHRGDLQV
jgi:membrane associated rhomboid family serine protease